MHEIRLRTDRRTQLLVDDRLQAGKLGVRRVTIELEFLQAACRHFDRRRSGGEALQAAGGHLLGTLLEGFDLGLDTAALFGDQRNIILQTFDFVTRRHGVSPIPAAAKAAADCSRGS